jgi:hypothetical protein
MALFYCLIWDSTNLEGQVPVFRSHVSAVRNFQCYHWEGCMGTRSLSSHYIRDMDRVEDTDSNRSSTVARCFSDIPSAVSRDFVVAETCLGYRCIAAHDLWAIISQYEYVFCGLPLKPLDISAPQPHPGQQTFRKNFVCTAWWLQISFWFRIVLWCLYTWQSYCACVVLQYRQALLILFIFSNISLRKHLTYRPSTLSEYPRTELIDMHLVPGKCNMYDTDAVKKCRV